MKLRLVQVKPNKTKRKLLKIYTYVCMYINITHQNRKWELNAAVALQVSFIVLNCPTFPINPADWPFIPEERERKGDCVRVNVRE